MIGDLIAPVPASLPGQIAKQHYAYEKNGSASLLASIEPLTGKRIMDVCARRRKIKFARHFQKVAAEFPAAKKNHSRSRESEHAQCECLLRSVRGGGGVSSGTKIRVYLHAQVSQLVEYDLDRVFRHLKTMLEVPNSEQRKIGSPSAKNCQRTKNQTNQNQLAVFD